MVERIALIGKRGAGRYSLVDDGDYDWMCAYHWHLDTPNGKEYARTQLPGGGHVRMHVLIMGRPGIDHANGDGLDNRRENLRDATWVQQMQNRAKSPGCSSQFKGVSWSRQHGRWYAYCGTSGKGRRFLGLFTDEIEAARAYDAAATEMFGAFARLNFPPAH
jgi:hypothetical protein